MASTTEKVRPSARWTSYDDWDYNGMKERLETFMATLNKPTLVRHAELIMGQKFSVSEPFSAGQYWACFELVAADGSLVIARVRLPKHPNDTDAVDEQSELYSITCEVAAMTFLRGKVTSVPIPRLYTYAGPGSQWAADAGAIYMLIEGFYGNTLQDVQFNICRLPVSTQEHIISQWTYIQAELATITFPKIGSISSISETGSAVISELSTGPADGLTDYGPFSDTAIYFTEIGVARFRNASKTSPSDERAGLGALVFIDIVQSTDLFTSPDGGENFHFNHMDMGTQNILVDDDFNFLAVIDFEFAQTAPWQVNHYPMPFALTPSEAKIEEILKDPNHLAHHNISRQVATRSLYRQKFQDAEQDLQKKGRPLQRSIARLLDGAASRIYGCLEMFGRCGDDEDLIHEMVRLAYGFDTGTTKQYLDRMMSRMEGPLALQLPCKQTLLEGN